MKPDVIHTVDLHVGRRLKMRRKMLRMSQEALGLALGISFQQVQKYECGANRISASKLFQAAGVLSVSPSFFFEGLPSTDSGGRPMLRFLTTSEGIELASSFSKIQSGKIRCQILAMCKSMVDADIRTDGRRGGDLGRLPYDPETMTYGVLVGPTRST